VDVLGDPAPLLLLCRDDACEQGPAMSVGPAQIVETLLELTRLVDQLGPQARLRHGDRELVGDLSGDPVVIDREGAGVDRGELQHPLDPSVRTQREGHDGPEALLLG
jgi:hypothetical protein